MNILSESSGGFHFSWDLGVDCASLEREGARLWEGSLLPSFLLAEPGEKPRFCAMKATCCQTMPEGWRIALACDGVANGRIDVLAREDGFSVRDFRLEWVGAAQRIYAMLVGVSELPEDRRLSSGYLERDCFPDWTAWGYCVPSAKAGPVQSFFRCFDLGHCTIPLGSFGPAMGVPYAAAFPRPVLSAALGGDAGWVCFGAGEVPDAALSLKIEASNGCLEWRYREDLWGAPEGMVRTWDALLEITFAPVALDAFRGYFDRFPRKSRNGRNFENIDIWGTWGEFKEGIYDVHAFAERVKSHVDASLIIIDEGWETFDSSGVPGTDRFPDFKGMLDEVKAGGLQVGLWQSLGWVDDLTAADLTPADVLQSAAGVPVQVNWQINPRAKDVRHFCPDPSSPAARDFIAKRTKRTIREFSPELLKLDFTYGVPGPDQSTASDPALRGERMALALMRVASEAAREADPEVRLYGYALHPLYHEWFDVVGLDDLGDCGAAEAAGHGQWTVWASLLGGRGMSVSASSGYHWEAEQDVLLNSAILGAPGSNLRLDRGATEGDLLRRKALHRWYRRPTEWKPLWLNSLRGSLDGEPAPKCLGRLEKHGAEQVLTALALRGTTGDCCDASLKGLQWEGSWALISQDNRNIFESTCLACIPVNAGHLILPATGWTTAEVVYEDRAGPMDRDAAGHSDACHTLCAGADGLMGFLIRR